MDSVCSLGVGAGFYSRNFASISLGPISFYFVGMKLNVSNTKYELFPNKIRPEFSVLYVPVCRFKSTLRSMHRRILT